ncbi:MAG: hypothetical protein WDN46_10495 [Methylocella sp.]
MTAANVNVYMQGAGEKCVIVENNSQSMLFFNSTNLSSIYMKDVRIQPNAVISSVTGVDHTAALYIKYPNGSIGGVNPLVLLDNVKVVPLSPAACAINGIYLNDAINVVIKDPYYLGCTAPFLPNSTHIVIDGTHSPNTITIQHPVALFAQNGVLAPAVATGGWQGVRVYNQDCVECFVGINMAGSADGSSDFFLATGGEGDIAQNAVLVNNVQHVNINNNYYFITSIGAPGAPTSAFPTCYEVAMSIPVVQTVSHVEDNTCSGQQATGFTSRAGIFIQGAADTPVSSSIGPNNLAVLEVGIAIGANTSGVLIAKQNVTSVATELSDGGVPGGNTYIPPLARRDAATQAAGLVGEIMSLSVPNSSAVSQPTSGTPINIGSIALTPGNWLCNGTVWTKPAATTTTSSLLASLSTTSATNAAAGSVGAAESSSAIPANVAESVNFGPAVFNVSAATTLFLVGNASFAVSTMALYGSAQCQRYM